MATAPGTAPKVQVGETSLQDFFARITINEAGRINLRDIVQGRAANPTPATAATAAASAPVPTASAASATQPVHTAARDPLAPVVQFGPMSLVNGKVLFSDFFIKPNYSADLTELTGKLGASSRSAPGSRAPAGRTGATGPRRGLRLAGGLWPTQPPDPAAGAGHCRQGARPGPSRRFRPIR